jgi:parallel beta-helix repeat protein
VRDVRLVNCTFYANHSHGLQIIQDVQGVTAVNCRAYRNGLGTGAHGFSVWSDSATAPKYIRFILCEASNNVDFDGVEGAGFQADDNASYVDFISCHSHDNEGPGFAWNTATNCRLIGSIATRNIKPGLYMTSTAASGTIIGNTFYDNSRLSAFEAHAEIYASAVGAINHTISNNIILQKTGRSIATAVKFAASTGNAGVTNAIYGFGTAATNASLTGTVTTDPLLDSSFLPKASSPCINAGTLIDGTVLKDFYGKDITASPDIGAVQVYTARTLRNA